MQSQSTLTNKNFRMDGNAIGLQRLVNSCKQANKTQSQELGEELQNFKLQRFPAKGKM
jgi:hypothetical protein